jgi:hypothetical protein
MGLINLNGLGNLISNAGGGQFVDIFNQVANPINQVVSPILNLGMDFGTAMIKLPISLMNSAGAIAQSLATPTMLYLVLGVCVIGGIAVIKSGGVSKFPR